MTETKFAVLNYSLCLPTITHPSASYSIIYPSRFGKCFFYLHRLFAKKLRKISPCAFSRVVFGFRRRKGVRKKPSAESRRTESRVRRPLPHRKPCPQTVAAQKIHRPKKCSFAQKIHRRQKKYCFFVPNTVYCLRNGTAVSRAPFHMCRNDGIGRRAGLKIRW